MDIEQRVDRLRQASQQYYETGTSFFTDSEFDTELELIRSLDPNNPILTEVGHGYVLRGIDDKEKFEHPIPVGSIEKTKALQKLHDFLDKHSTYSTKIDGNSVVCYYKNGSLFKVVTRGSNNIGIDRTAKFISKVPNKIPVLGYVAVRGEAAIKKSEYTVENGFDITKASRNAVAGAISRKDDYMEVFTFVDFIAYTFIDCDTGEDLYSKIDWSNHFIVEHQKNECERIFKNVDEFKLINKTDYPYEADGIVFKTGSEYLAFKFEDESAPTQENDVVYSIGKNQVMVPVSLFETIELQGASISRASLGSYSRACEIGAWPLYENHVIEVIRANEVIPYVTRTISKSGKILKEGLPECPACGEVSEQIGEHVFCTNPECPNLDSSRLYNFSEQFYPEGLSDKIVEKFFEHEGIDTVFDLLEYDINELKFLNIPGIGDSHMEKIHTFLKSFSGEIDAVVIYKTFLNGSGERASVKIVESGFDVYSYLESDNELDRLKKLSNFNSNLITELVRNRENIREFVSLRKIKQEKKIMVEQKGTFVISGVRLKGDDIVKVAQAGWKEGSSVSKNTNILVVKDPASTSSKTQKARELNIPVVSLEEFLGMINN
jgi:DNA ligase (NAD+)